jgi:SAM-dependent methyltransferase
MTSTREIGMHFASYYRWLVATRRWGMPITFDLPVLDIGADDGEFLSRISAPHKVGLDLAARARVGLAWVQANACRLPFTDVSFGQVFAFDVIEHVDDDKALLTEAMRLLLPGGTLWLSTTAQNFAVFPGGRIQARLERSWRHVRRGYSAQMIKSLLPPGCTVDIWWWNEPAFRTLYVLLVALWQKSPRLAQSLVRRLVMIDARARQGQSGHLFARITQM